MKMKSKKIWMHKKLQNLLFSYSDDVIFKVAWGGRYGSKTMAYEAAAVRYVLQNPGTNFLCVRGTQTSIADSLLAGIKKMIYMMGVENNFDIGEKYIKTKPDASGRVSRFLFMGAVAYENFRSLENISVCWVDEAHVIPEKAWDVIIPSIRGENSEIWITFNAKKKDDWVYDHFITKEDPLARVVKINYTDNKMLPDRELLKAETMKNTNLRKYRHIYLGELDDQPEDALWTDESFIYDSNVQPEDFERIVIAVDPSGSDSTTADECGIVVAGKMGKYGYVLEDASKKLTHLGQAKMAIKLYHKWQADAIIVEKNGVGSGTKTIIYQIDKNIPVKEVNARRGKILRAEPVAAVYEDDRVKHAKVFPELEYEMTSYTGDPKDKSPNRLDAAVYAITELLLKRGIVAPENMVEADEGELVVL
jgi:phage terminase large subunit-like protein